MCRSHISRTVDFDGIEMKFAHIFLIFSIFAAHAFASSVVRERRQAGRQCPDICTAQFDPVCGSKGNCFRVFSNGCQLGVHNCQASPKDRYTQVDPSNCNGFADFNFNAC